MQSQPGMARVEPDAVFESDAPFLRMAGPHQDRAVDSVGIGQVWTYRQSPLDLGESALVVSAHHQCLAQTCTGFRVIAVECNRPSR